MALCTYSKVSELKMVMNHSHRLSCHDARLRILFIVNREKSEQHTVYATTAGGKNVFPSFCLLIVYTVEISWHWEAESLTLSLLS